jgi:hypothetical protein
MLHLVSVVFASRKIEPLALPFTPRSSRTCGRFNQVPPPAHRVPRISNLVGVACKRGRILSCRVKGVCDVEEKLGLVVRGQIKFIFTRFWSVEPAVKRAARFLVPEILLQFQGCLIPGHWRVYTICEDRPVNSSSFVTRVVKPMRRSIIAWLFKIHQ